MVSKFEDELPLDPESEIEGGLATGVELGPCAMGGVAPGVTLTRVLVLLVQHDGDRVATASGRSGDLIRTDGLRPPYSGFWAVNTRLEEGSPQFAVGKPALATAMAVVKHDDGDIDVERWSQAVTIVSGGGR